MDLTAYPSTDRFKVIDTVAVPHPYCIGPKHVAFASDYYGGLLGKEAILGAESKGIRCAAGDCFLPFEKHEEALLIEVHDSRDLQTVYTNGLQQFLLAIKDQTTLDGFVGFVFKQVR